MGVRPVCHWPWVVVLPVGIIVLAGVMLLLPAGRGSAFSDARSTGAGWHLVGARSRCAPAAFSLPLALWSLTWGRDPSLLLEGVATGRLTGAVALAVVSSSVACVGSGGG